MPLATEHLEPLKLARYEFTLRAREDVVLPPFLGSTLRGSFGHALKEVACSIPHGDCSRCLLIERCAYPRIFEPSPATNNGLLTKGQQAPRPFVFIPPNPGPPQGLRARDDLLRWRMGVRAGMSLAFGLTLIGEAAFRDLPYVIYAIGLMAHNGFGSERGQFELEKVVASDLDGKPQPVYVPGSTRVNDHDNCCLSLRQLTEIRLAQLARQANTQFQATAAASVQSSPAPRSSRNKSEVTLRFLTPTRLRIKGETVENPTFAQLISSLSLRLSMVAQCCGNASLGYDYKSLLERAREVGAKHSSLRLMALDRYSNRQPGKLKLDGFMGEITFAHPDVAQFLPLLTAGEFLNVGSATAFGLGRYNTALSH